MSNPFKKAVLLTGAGARISQEVAILDQLIAQKGLELNQDDTLLTGFSSGSLNILAINGCFRKDNPASWDDYYKGTVLANLKDSSVFKAGPLPFSTKPLRGQLDNVLEKFCYNVMSDLPFKSFVLTYSRRVFETVWADSRSADTANLILSDVFMSSTAIPVVFPAQTIATAPGKTSKWPDGKFNDGGSLGQFKRFAQHLGAFVQQNGAFEEMYIISPMREKHGDEVPLTDSSDHVAQAALNEVDVSTTAMHAFSKFLNKLDAWNKANGMMAKNIYVCIPNLQKNYPMLAFADQIPKYNEVVDWAKSNPDQLAIPLSKYLEAEAAALS